VAGAARRNHPNKPIHPANDVILSEAEGSAAHPHPNQPKPRRKSFPTDPSAICATLGRPGITPGPPVRQELGCIELAEVRVQEGEPLENALRRFKRKVQTEDIIKEVKRHSFYLKPGEKRRVKEALARKRNRKKARKEAD
jgi:small subunit ribosomal protein S21